LFDVDNYLFVLYGMKYPTAAKRMTDYEERYFEREVGNINLSGKKLLDELLGHRDWLDKFLQAYAATKRA
jgi:tryptophan 7-halogenase